MEFTKIRRGRFHSNGNSSIWGYGVTSKQFRVYVNRPGVKGKMLGEIKVKRKAFPDALFPV